MPDRGHSAKGGFNLPAHTHRTHAPACARAAGGGGEREERRGRRRRKEEEEGEGGGGVPATTSSSSWTSRGLSSAPALVWSFDSFCLTTNMSYKSYSVSCFFRTDGVVISWCMLVPDNSRTCGIFTKIIIAQNDMRWILLFSPVYALPINNTFLQIWTYVVEFRMDVYAKGNGNGRKWRNTEEAIGSRLQ